MLQGEQYRENTLLSSTHLSMAKNELHNRYPSCPSLRCYENYRYLYPTMTKYIANEAHFKEVLALVPKVKNSLWIGTSDIKDLYVSVSTGLLTD